MKTILLLFIPFTGICQAGLSVGPTYTISNSKGEYTVYQRSNDKVLETGNSITTTLKTYNFLLLKHDEKITENEHYIEKLQDNILRLVTILEKQKQEIEIMKLDILFLKQSKP